MPQFWKRCPLVEWMGEISARAIIEKVPLAIIHNNSQIGVKRDSPIECQSNKHVVYMKKYINQIIGE